MPYINKNTKVKSSRSKTVVYIVIALSAAALLIAGFMIYRHVQNGKKQTAADGPTPAQIKQQSEVDAENKKTYTSDPKNTNTETPSTPTEPTTSSNLSLSAKQESNGSVTVIAKLPGVSSGSCSLSVTNNGKAVTKTADIIYQPEFSTCAGFSVPQNELGMGTWTFVLTISGSNTGKATTTLEVK